MSNNPDDREAMLRATFGASFSTPYDTLFASLDQLMEVYSNLEDEDLAADLLQHLVEQLAGTAGTLGGLATVEGGVRPDTAFTILQGTILSGLRHALAMHKDVCQSGTCGPSAALESFLTQAEETMRAARAQLEARRAPKTVLH